ncbi:hypothetical protein STEG23_027302, partial [Scotinomys teguina]
MEKNKKQKAHSYHLSPSHKSNCVGSRKYTVYFISDRETEVRHGLICQKKSEELISRDLIPEKMWFNGSLHVKHDMNSLFCNHTGLVESTESEVQIHCVKDNNYKVKAIVKDEIVRTWKQSRCSSTEEWIEKMWYIYTMEYYSAEKNNNIMKFAGKWKELENIILSELTQTQEDKH